METGAACLILAAWPGGTLLWRGGLIVVVLLLALLVLAAKAYLKSPRICRGEAFSMDKLRELRDTGQISEAEYGGMRRAALGLGPAASEKSKTQSNKDMEVDDGTQSAADSDPGVS